jgi:uncharacterized protein YecT (DUF1311 family)
MTIQANAQKLSGWLASQPFTAATAKKADLEQASSALGLSKVEVNEARRFLLDAAFTRIETGQRAGAATGRGAVAAGFGQLDATQNASLVARTRNQSDPKLAAFEASQYTLLDVENLMKQLGVGAEAAKKHIGEKILGGKEADLRQMGITPDNFDSYELRDTFKRSGYSEADAAKALASFGFLSDLNDAKEYIGLKIINGPDYERDILGPIGVTRHDFDSHDCMAAFEKSTYSDADVREAKRSFDFLRGCSNDEVKEYIGLKIVNGYESMMADAGITPHSFDRQDCLAAFSKSTYSKADVAKAKEAFSFLSGLPDVEVKEYIGLKIVNGYEEMLNHAGISQHNFDDHDCLEAFNKSKYDSKDVKAARESFDFLRGSSEIEVKQYIGLKIVNQYEEMLAEVGILQGPNKQPEIVSQQQMNQEAYAGLEKAQAKLNDGVRALRKGMEPEDKTELQASLDAFKGYVAAEGNFEGNLVARGGSMQPMIDAGTQARLTNQLAKEVARGLTTYNGTARIGDDDPQQVMNQKAWAAATKADTKMQGLVAKLEAKLDPEGKAELNAAQTAFASFREAHSTLTGNLEARGGSLAPLISACTHEALTRQRAAILEAHLETLG